MIVLILRGVGSKMFEHVRQAINEYFGQDAGTPLPEPPSLAEIDLEKYTMTGVPRIIDRTHIRPGGVYDQREVRKPDPLARTDHTGPNLGSKLGDSQLRHIEQKDNTFGEDDLLIDCRGEE